MACHTARAVTGQSGCGVHVSGLFCVRACALFCAFLCAWKLFGYLCAWGWVCREEEGIERRALGGLLCCKYCQRCVCVRACVCFCARANPWDCAFCVRAWMYLFVCEFVRERRSGSDRQEGTEWRSAVNGADMCVLCTDLWNCESVPV